MTSFMDDSLDITPAPANEFGLKSVLFKKDNVNNGCAPNSNDIEGSKVETCEKNFRYEVSEAFLFIITYIVFGRGEPCRK